MRFEALEDRRLLAITVNTLVDELDGSLVDGDISLRDAIAAASAGETINFASTVLQGNGATIHLTLGELVIGKSLSIVGPRANELFISAARNDATPLDQLGDGVRIFRIDDGNAGQQIEVSISGLTLTGGDVTGDGGAIHSREKLTLAGVSIEESAAVGRGGGVFNLGGALTLDSSTVWGNSAGGDGGGLASQGGTVVVTSSTLSGNRAGGAGGGLANFDGATNILFSTITENRSAAGLGGGMASRGNASTGTHLGSSIVAANLGGDVVLVDGVANSFTSNGFNLVGTGSGQGAFGGTDQAGVVDPRLAPLAYNGGPTQTHSPLTGSPAIDAGNQAAVTGVNAPTSDQRGTPHGRISDGDGTGGARIDIGAFEVAPTIVVTSALDTVSANDGVMTLREAINAATTAAAPRNIRFDSSLSGQAIVLTNGALSIATDLSVDATNLPNGLTIDASGNDTTPAQDNGNGSRVFSVNDATNVFRVFALRGVTLTGGDALTEGGAILSSEDLALYDVTFVDNFVRGRGGAISFLGKRFSAHSLTLNNNRATTDGGGIFVDVGSTTGGAGVPVVDIVASEIVSNRTGSFGAGLFLYVEDGVGRIRDVELVNNQAINGTNPSGGGAFIRGAINAMSQGARVKVIDSTFRGNVATGAQASGGGIEIVGAGVSVDRSVIANNSVVNSGEGGGGIAVFTGRADVVRSSITGNTATGGSVKGGGIYVVAPGALQLASSTVANNSASSSGGGIWSSGALEIRDSTINNNSAILGGGIHHRTSAFTMLQSTVSGNTVTGNGGGLYLFATQPQTFTIRHSTITANTSPGFGGGLTVVGATLVADHTLAAANVAPLSEDIAALVGAIVSPTYSLIGSNKGNALAEAPIAAPDANGNRIGGTVSGTINPLLSPLVSGGGETMVHLPLAGSPAVNAGNASAVAGAATVPKFDQRGTPYGRIAAGRIDIGAVEQQSVVTGTLTVDTLVDEDDGNFGLGDLSLREAIGLANGSFGNNVIEFAASLTVLGPASIVLTRGDLAITENVTVTGPGSHLLTIDASGNDPTPNQNNGDGSRVFRIFDGAVASSMAVTMSGLRLTGGDVGANSVFPRVGGAIISYENLLLDDLEIANNYAVGINASPVFEGAGGMFLQTNQGQSVLTNLRVVGNSTAHEAGGLQLTANQTAAIELNDSWIQGNAAGDPGGGIALVSTAGSGRIDVRRSTIINNTADAIANGLGGGGIAIFGSAPGAQFTISDSTVTGNSTLGRGGGITVSMGASTGTVRVVNSTVSDNFALLSGAGFNVSSGSASTIAVEYSTIAHNRLGATPVAGDGSGAGVQAFNGAAIVRNSIVANNLVAANSPNPQPLDTGYAGTNAGLTFANALIGAHSGATFTNGGGNLVGTSTAPINPLLGPLTYNGGTTMTHALLPSSPAIDAGNAAAVAGVGNVPLNDQRGPAFTRVYDGNNAGGSQIDIGAYEHQPTPAAATGDFSGDGVTNAADYTKWRDSFGATGLTPYSGADGNGNGRVDVGDYEVWKANFGRVLPGAGGVSGESVASVAELLRTESGLPPADPEAGYPAGAGGFAPVFGVTAELGNQPPVLPGVWWMVERGADGAGGGANLREKLWRGSGVTAGAVAEQSLLAWVAERAVDEREERGGGADMDWAFHTKRRGESESESRDDVFATIGCDGESIGSGQLGG